MNLISSMLIMVPVLVSVAYLTLLESKVLSYTQLSKGPNKVGGITGVAQPLADGIKLFTNELLIPSHANILMYMGAPMLALVLSLVPWVLLPFNSSFTGNFFNSDYSMLYLLAMMGVGMFAMALSGWASSSKYAYLGSISAVAQMMSYEISLSLILMSLVIMSKSMNLVVMAQLQASTGINLFLLWPMAGLYCMSVMAETNSAPFDLTEGESELVSGYNVEYGSMPFAIFFLAEYSHMLFASSLMVKLFLPFTESASCPYTYAGWFMALFNCVLMAVVSFAFIWVSTSFPSISYEQLMGLLWKKLLPISLVSMLLMVSITVFSL